MKKLMELLGKDVELKLDRDWCWVSGDTKPVKDELKNLGFQWSPRRKEWYHRDAKSLGITSDLVEVKAIAKASSKSTKANKSTKATSKASKKSTSKSSKASRNARSTYKYGAKRFIRDFADKEELAEILELIVGRMSE